MMTVKDLIKEVRQNHLRDFINIYAKNNGISKDDECFPAFQRQTLRVLIRMELFIKPQISNFIIMGYNCYESDGTCYFTTGAYKKKDLDNIPVYDCVDFSLDQTPEEKLEFIKNHPIPESYAYEFNSWAETLGYEVDENTINTYSPEVVLSDILNEMTFFGDEEGMLEQREIIEDRIAEVETVMDLPEESIKEHFVSLDDYLESIDWKDERTEEEKNADYKKAVDAMYLNWCSRYAMFIGSHINKDGNKNRINFIRGCLLHDKDDLIRRGDVLDMVRNLTRYVSKEVKDQHGVNELLDYAAVQSGIDHIHEADRWISAKDNPPDLDEYVIVYSETNGVWIGKRLSETDYYLVDDIGEDNTITHWMPRPMEPSI